MSDTDNLFEEFFGKKEKKEEKKPEQPKPTTDVQESTVAGPMVVATKEDSQPEPKEAAFEFPTFGPPEPSPPTTEPSTALQEPQKLEEPKPLESIKTRATAEEGEFNVQEATDEGAIGIMDYGDKGGGKTTFALSYPGIIAILSYDRQAVPIKTNMYKDDKRITVYDAIRYYDKASAQRLLETSDTTFRYTNAILDQLEKDRPDVVVFDGSEIMQAICEMTMRYRNNLQPFQGIANLNLWKERNMYVDQLFLRALAIAKKAVICTAYIKKDEIIKDGETIVREDVPKWVGTIMTDTRVVIRVKPENTKEGQVYKATIESSKDPHYKTGLIIDITGTKGIEKIWEASKCD